MSFAKLKQQSGKKSLEQLTSELTKLNSNQESKSDDRFWYPNVDKAGNGYAVIRLLPAPEGEDIPFIRMFEHGFKGPTGKWYIENSLTTIGKTDPVGELNSKLWNTGLESDKETVRKQKRKLHFVSNIYVVSDQQNPQNEGKVFLFKFGKKLFDKINEAMNPQFADEAPMNPFDLWEGANFKLKIRNVEGYRNYDKSEFASVGPLFSDESEMEKVWNKCHSLQAFHSPSNFKSYDELKSRLHAVLGSSGEASSHSSIEEAEMPQFEMADAPKPKATPAKVTTVEDDEEDMAEFFSKLNE